MNCSSSEHLSSAFYIWTHDHLQSSIAAVVCYLMLDWRLNAISRETLILIFTIYEWHHNLMRYGSAARLHTFTISWSKKLSQQNEIMLLNWLLQEKWHMQNEMIYWLWNEHRILVSQSTISCLLHKNRYECRMLISQSVNLTISQVVKEEALTDFTQL